MSEDETDEGSATSRASKMSSAAHSYHPYRTTNYGPNGLMLYTNQMHSENLEATRCPPDLGAEGVNDSDFDSDVSETGKRFADNEGKQQTELPRAS